MMFVFLFLLNFYQRFILNAVEKQASLFDQISEIKEQDDPLRWSYSTRTSFDVCRQPLVDAAQFIHLISDAVLRLDTDTSNAVVGTKKIIPRQTNIQYVRQRISGRVFGNVPLHAPDYGTPDNFTNWPQTAHLHVIVQNRKNHRQACPTNFLSASVSTLHWTYSRNKQRRPWSALMSRDCRNVGLIYHIEVVDRSSRWPGTPENDHRQHEKFTTSTNLHLIRRYILRRLLDGQGSHVSICT